MGEPTCTFTGHRAEKLPWGYNENDPRCRRLKRTLYDTLEAVYESGFHRFICGMAEGCDLYFCEAVLALCEDHPDITLEAAVPFTGQAEHWGAAQRQRYEALLARCDTVTVLQEHYSPGCMMKRNRYMVDRSSLLLACFDGRPGGTMSTIVYAERQGLKTVIIEL